MQTKGDHFRVRVRDRREMQSQLKLRKQHKKESVPLFATDTTNRISADTAGIPTALLGCDDDDDDRKKADRKVTWDFALSSRRDEGGKDGDVELMETSEIDALIPRASAGVFVTWIIISSTVYWSAPAENIVYLEGAARNTAFLAFVVFAIAILTSMLPYAVGLHGKRMSGVMIAGFVIQIIALITNGILAFGPAVVYTDPVTKSLAYLTRYCEWTPLAGFMTFLSEAVDLPADRKNMKMPVLTAWLQFISAGCGIVCPLCPGPVSWWVVMTISCVTYAFMFVRVARRRKILESQEFGPTALEIERRERLVFGYRLITACTAFWTFLVLIYFINMFIHLYFPPDHPVRIPGLAMIVDTIFDLAAKVIYMKLIISVHESVFDDAGQARRRLKELRHMLDVLWESSSDVIVIAVRGKRGDISVMLSPTYSYLVTGRSPQSSGGAGQKALVVELRLERNAPSTSGDSLSTMELLESRGEVSATVSTILKRAYLVDADVPMDMNVKEKTVDIGLTDHRVVEAQHIISAIFGCNSCRDSLMLRDLARPDGSVAKCEIKVTKHMESAVIAMIRDATERYRLAEAEQRAVLETIARQKDAQAVNRFTRHEVKNGLLASIELCDSLRSNLGGISQHLSNQDGNSSRVDELNTALQDILETVLAEAMARDVIHEVYQPKLERLNVLLTLSNSCHDADKKSRFQIISRPSDLSYLLLDPQLLKYIHRNAVSNACKYGNQGGQVTTEICYDEAAEQFMMNVVNLPGANHGELVAMGEEAAESVFRQGKRLHAQLENPQGSTAAVSTGDGAWIMKKCAKTLGGTCSIRFYHDKTVFTFRCPSAHFHKLNESRMPWGEPKDFTAPEAALAVGVDDSKIQRKLLTKLFLNAGFAEDKHVLLGETAEEILNVCDLMRNVIEMNPESKILILMDENLDVYEEGKHILVSGSSCLQNMLNSLDPAEEDRVLALVRSANDSGEDVSVYASRSHGFFPKAPMKRDRVREILGEMWYQRFHESKPKRRSLSQKVLDTARKETAEALSFVGNLVGEGVTQSRWPQIWGALEKLKDTLIRQKWSLRIEPVIELIGGMDGNSVPSEFDKKWKTIRDTVVESVFKGNPATRHQS